MIRIGGQVAWSNLSDGRFKTQVQEDVAGLSFINALRPVTYHFDGAALNTFYNHETSTDHSDLEKIKFSGFIAQEVESAASEVGYDFSGVSTPVNDKDTYSLRYGEFVVPLVKAVQELSAENERLKAEVERLSALEARLGALEALLIKSE